MREMTIWIGLGLLGFAALAACSDTAPQGCASDQECRGERLCRGGMCTEPAEEETAPEEETSCDAGTIDGESACDYYDQFSWEATDTFVAGRGRFPDGLRGGFRFIVFLERSGDAVAFYDEGWFGHGYHPYEEGGKRDRSPHLTRIDSSWRVEDTELVIGDVLRCNGGAYCDINTCSEGQREDPKWQEREALECLVQRPVGRKEAVDQPVSLREGGVVLGPDESATPDDPVFDPYEPE